ncbi:MAG: hypothetical protein HY319_16005 [Armatimonadetes bacterium]|nr:hypothetical protein [Armatimonadota bacterium]
MRQGEDAIREKLQGIEQSRHLMSRVVESHGQVVGYLLAWPSRSHVDVPRPEKVVYIDDMQVLPGFEHELWSLLGALAQDIERCGLRGLHIEGICRRRSFKVFSDHQSLIGRLGYELERTYEYWDDKADEEMCWMRWAPTSLTGPAVVSTSDSIDFSDDLEEELLFDFRS